MVSYLDALKDQRVRDVWPKRPSFTPTTHAAVGVPVNHPVPSTPPTAAVSAELEDRFPSGWSPPPPRPTEYALTLGPRSWQVPIDDALLSLDSLRPHVVSSVSLVCDWVTERVQVVFTGDRTPRPLGRRVVLKRRDGCRSSRGDSGQ